MSETGVAAVRWRLPARRKRFIAIVAPVGFLVGLLGFGIAGRWPTGLSLGALLAGLTIVLTCAFARLDPDPGTPNPPRLFPAPGERRRMLRVVRRRLPIDEAEPERLRPLVEETGRSSARAVWLAMGAGLVFGGGLIDELLEVDVWGIALRGSALLTFSIAASLSRRDVRACTQFLDRY